MIDTHVHTWNFKRAEYEWLKHNTTILNRNYLIDELETERKAAGITKGVLVQAANTIEETNYLLETALKTEWIKGVVGWLPLTNPEQSEKILSSQYIHQSYIKGVRHLIHDEPDARWLLQPEVLESLQLLVDYNLTYDVVGILDEHLKCAVTIAEKMPSLKLVIDHLNHPQVGINEHASNWFALMKEAAQHKNMYAKISGLGTCIEKNNTWNADDIKPYIEFALETFGTDRCFCGGDWPVSLLAGSYAHTWNVYKEVLSSLLCEDDLKKVYDENAVLCYNL
ncbi:amidohydrolase family protein [Parafilimonas terrae]|jgi:L-fuconolactonase|uniref:L-fuconolactonase n=1 Tax=Parafilimonas terrae TaxID=1465490 RepID=A0A1I5TMY9_9BACT|nr:amidohydrolase family protein [Parafilimonas terrae]SFP84410.1 L-fuconolactonase [Parafilimonas terrae]